MFCCRKKAKKPSFVYNVPLVMPKPEGETVIHRNPLTVGKDLHLNVKGITNLQEMFEYTFAKNKKEYMLGSRPFSKTPKQMHKEKYGEKEPLLVEDLGHPPLNDFFTFMTGETVQKKAMQMGSGIANLNLAPELNEFENFKCKFIGIYGKNSPEWIIVDIACAIYGYTLAPIYDTLGEQASKTIFEQTNFITLFTTCSHLDGIVKSFNKGDTGRLKNIVIMDNDNLKYFESKYAPVMKELENLKNSNKINLYFYSSILEAGAKLVKAPKLSSDTIFTLSYTSGTTGVPKGAMISHKNAISGVTANGNGAGDPLPSGEQKVCLNYLPLAHVMERLGTLRNLYEGGCIGVFSGDIMKIKDDLAILKPTSFGSAPRFYNKISDAIQGLFGKATGLKAILIKWAVETKLENLRKYGEVTHWFYDAILFNKVKQILGGKNTVFLSGSAPLSKEVMAFIRICFCAPMIEGYGQTEAVAAEFTQNKEDMHSIGYVGGIWEHLEFKLVDVPEMKYFSTHLNEDGTPCPQGEIWVRGSSVVVGYYKNREEFDKTVDKDGWLHSGDIGELGPNRNMKIIDRAKNIFKLSQGEYIAPDRLAEIFRSTKCLVDIFIYGDSLKSCIVAVACPDENSVKEMAKDCGLDESLDFEKLCQNQEIKNCILQELKKTGVTNGLKSFELVKAIHLTPLNFQDLKLLTDAFKVKRIETKNHFMSKFDELYKRLD